MRISDWSSDVCSSDLFTGAEIAASPNPAGLADTWPLIMRAKASYYPGRSGDLVVALKPLVTPIADPTRGSVATHGSFWVYDRRVPNLFCQSGKWPWWERCLRTCGFGWSQKYSKKKKK